MKFWVFSVLPCSSLRRSNSSPCNAIPHSPNRAMLIYPPNTKANA